MLGLGQADHFVHKSHSECALGIEGSRRLHPPEELLGGHRAAGRHQLLAGLIFSYLLG